MRTRDFGVFVIVVVCGCGTSSSGDGGNSSGAGQASGGDSGSGATATGGTSSSGASGAGGTSGASGTSSTGGASGASGASGGSSPSGGTGGTSDGGEGGSGTGETCTEGKPIVITSEEELEAFAARRCEILEGSLVVSSQTLESLDALGPQSTLRTVTGSLSFSDNPLLESLEGLRGLEEVGASFVLRGNQFTTLDGLETLRRVGTDPANDSVIFADNPRLTSLDALDELSSVSASVSVTNNPELTTLAGLDQLRATISVTIAGNALLAEIGGLTALEEATTITVASNQTLRSAAFPSLVQAGSLAITSNPLLESVALPMLTGAENLTIAGNETLVTLGTLSELEEVGLLVIGGNAKLPQCFVDELDERLMACNMSCSGNDANATCN